MHKQVSDAIHRFNLKNNLEEVNLQNVEEVSTLYNKLMKNIKNTKNFVLDRMDSIYGNFISPSRWNY